MLFRSPLLMVMGPAMPCAACEATCLRKMSGVLLIPFGSDPVESCNGNMFDASLARVLPRVEAGSVLTSWQEFGDWKQRTTLRIRFYGGMSVEGVISPDYEGCALITFSARLSRLMLNEGRAFSSLFSKLWTSVFF